MPTTLFSSKIYIDSLKKLAALGVPAGFLLVLPFSAVPASAESKLSVHHGGLPKHAVEDSYRP